MTLPVSDFREGRLMVELLRAARTAGQRFDEAWADALRRIRRGRSYDNERWSLARNAFRHHREAWRRAYDLEPPTTLDNAGAALALVMETLYDDSEFAEAQWIALPEAA